MKLRTDPPQNLYIRLFSFFSFLSTIGIGHHPFDLIQGSDHIPLIRAARFRPEVCALLAIVSLNCKYDNLIEFRRAGVARGPHSVGVTCYFNG